MAVVVVVLKSFAVGMLTSRLVLGTSYFNMHLLEALFSFT
jgi:hypothetical protein